MDESPLNLAALTERLGVLRAAFASAEPYRHVVIDDFLDPNAARAALAAAPPLETMATRYAGIVEARSTDVRCVEERPALTAVFDALRGDAFAAWLAALTGIAALRCDPDLHGGGVHQGGPGDFLHVHADHNQHPTEPGLFRRINVLLYLSPRWDPAWGGALDLWDVARAAPVRSVAPAFNRCLIMDCHDRAYHGYRRLTTPPGVLRTSLAIYFYAPEPSPHQVREPHSTIFVEHGALRWSERLRIRVRRIADRTPALRAAMVRRAWRTLRRARPD